MTRKGSFTTRNGGPEGPPFFVSTQATDKSVAGQMRHRVDRGGALADLEVELGRGHVARGAGLGDGLAALDLLAGRTSSSPLWA